MHAPGVVPIFDAFFAGMREQGYEEGRDYVMDWRHTGGKPDAFDAYAVALVADGVDLFWCVTTVAAMAAKRATSTIPIVFSGLSDPVTSGPRLAWRNGGSAFRHGPVELNIQDADHPITRGFSKVRFVDESYWELVGDPRRYAEWLPRVFEIQGQRFDEGTEFIQVSRSAGPVRMSTVCISVSISIG